MKKSTKHQSGDYKMKNKEKIIKNLEFYSLVWDNNKKEVISINIFQNIRIQQDLNRICSKKLSKEEFKEEFKSALKSTYWSRVEYELNVSEVFSKDEKYQKIDVWTQIEPNMSILVDYLRSLGIFEE